ncbi:hypothetical protein FN846DRAFT_974033 [Sphaerosporella brunnea]|uniref:Cyclic nucleotide-binding domain-containing protein n=1 Tax=Sphaerosporella brunnea TaxID=1250544 RepID=A0A5J5EHN2_9PEZI|nr:hypothetical protein FN846DRAFT_974033 [Sphaerosporella brunnea]
MRTAGTILGVAGTAAVAAVVFRGSLAGCIVIVGGGAVGAAFLTEFVRFGAFFGELSVMIPRPITPSIPSPMLVVVDLLDFLRLRATLPERLLPASLLDLLLLPGLNKGDVDAATEAASVVATERRPCEEVVLNALELVLFFGDPDGVSPIFGVVCAERAGVRLAAGIARVLGVMPESL